MMMTMTKFTSKTGYLTSGTGFVLVVVLTVIFLSACQMSGAGAEVTKTAEMAQKVPTFDKNGNYTGFADLNQDSDPQKALARGCYVVDHGKLIGGKAAWETFLSKAENGETAFLRIANKIYPDQVVGVEIADAGTMFYDDLYYYEGKYYFFTYNGPGDIRSEGPYAYLRELKGMSGNPVKERTMYVLTDSLELSYKDVEWSFLSGNMDTVTKIHFEWLGFTIYMEENE